MQFYCYTVNEALNWATLLQAVLEQDVFHRSLLACCLEIVTFTYKLPGSFPFITEIFDIPVYHFYKVK